MEQIKSGASWSHKSENSWQHKTRSEAHAHHSPTPTPTPTPGSGKHSGVGSSRGRKPTSGVSTKLGSGSGTDSGSGSGSGTGTGSGIPSSPSPMSSPAGVMAGNGSASLGIPSGLLTSDKGIAFGWLPDSGNSGTMAKLNSAVGKNAATYGWYSQISGTTYDGSQLTQVLNDVVNSKAVFIPAVMPTKVKFADFNAALAGQVATVLKQFTDKNVEVWLRFAHEMNYYVTDGTYAGGSASEFVAAWKIMHGAVASNPKIKMFWSPNSASSATLQQWYPGTQYVDIVGMDVYPKSGSSFSSVYGDFYNAFSAKTNLPFAIGETGSGADDVSSKEAWLTQITNADYSAFPNYKAGCWFEYLKGGDDFRVTQPAEIKETMSNFNAA